MSIEKALIANAQPQVVARKLRELITYESWKGCIPQICIQPVRLEPTFIPISKINNSSVDGPLKHWEIDEPCY